MTFDPGRPCNELPMLPPRADREGPRVTRPEYYALINKVRRRQ
jgi:hypothetical protein